MRETFEDGSESYRTAHTDEAIAALRNPKVQEIGVYKPGSVITMPSGTRYTVQADGSWRRDKPEEEGGQS